jgi:hypothetical protein
MRLTTYAYPWDIARLGVDASLQEIRAAGIDAVDVAASYHPIDAISPLGGAHLFTLPRGAVLFPARARRYGRIQPHLADVAKGNTWPAIVERARALGLGVNAWTVTTFQPWMVDAHPEVARVLPSGDRVGSGVCASNDDVHEYLVALATDIVDQFGVDVLRLEGISTAAFDYGWLRPRVQIRTARLARELLSVCFCPGCTRRGAAAGIDVERVRSLVVDAIAAELELDDAAAAPDPGTALAADAELHAFVVLRERVVAEVLRAVRDAVAGPGAPRLSSSVLTPFRTLVGAAQAELVDEVAALLDDVVISPQATDARTQRVVELARAGDQLALGMLLVPVAFSASATSSTPKTMEQLTTEIEAAAALGIDEVSVYTWNLLRERDFDAIAAAVRRVYA